MVYRVYVEKKRGFDVKARQLARELHDILGIAGLDELRVIKRYDVEGADQELFRACVPTVFSEPQTDRATFEMPEVANGSRVFAVEFLPGQFDMCAASASECIQLISQGERPDVRTADVYVLMGTLDDTDLTAVKRYVINPVEAREASLAPRETLRLNLAIPTDVETLSGFCKLDEPGLAHIIDERGLAMDLADISFLRDYFKTQDRDPTITELRVIDTYWSDHCRHTTFGTYLDHVDIKDKNIQSAFERYLAIRHKLGRDGRDSQGNLQHPVTLMDMATIGARYLRDCGQLPNLDESDEINACTVLCKVDVNGRDEDWLYLFKNETHNHPTEIEPFGGAATCIGGAIRDPLSGRSYVYEAMRVTGAGNPLVPVADTLPHKLPQRKIVTTAAQGYSSYGNQIGLATGQVSELYHPGYVAKRLEIGAVVGATPADHVRREKPAPGDMIVLLGGRTGRDGIGGATGSSKAHTAHSLDECGAEVQKGNAPIERKLQRLFRRKDACRLIKRCNDFGAGGVSVAIGELADGLSIDLDRVPKKYVGLDGTELAISESQERMAVALAPEDIEQFVRYAHEENLEATVVAKVTDLPRLVMRWKGQTIVDISRTFLNSNGAPKHQNVYIDAQDTWEPAWSGATLQERMNSLVSDLNIASNKGLSERFDSTIGASSVLMPFGGIRQLTPALAMVAKLPVFGETTTVSGMAWGFNPYLMDANQYAGAYLSVVESISRMVATGFCHRSLYLTFQEYFERLRNAPDRWGKPVAALLGALDAQIDLGIAAIGGKDSMSGSFEDLDVPPTLVSFATGLGSSERIISPEYKGSNHRLILITPYYRADKLRPRPASLHATYDLIEDLVASARALSVSTAGYGCIAEEVFKSCLGNRIGADLETFSDPERLFHLAYGSFVVELADEAMMPTSTHELIVEPLGHTCAEYVVKMGSETILLSDLEEAWIARMEPVFPWRGQGPKVQTVSSRVPVPRKRSTLTTTFARPRVVLPVFPGTNCEYDSAAAFERVGAKVTTLVINNLTPQAIADSTDALAKEIRNSQIIMIPGGFSGGDEPDGSAKFITAFFRAPAVSEAVRDLLQARDGLILGICNGFQALVKLGLVPYGDIRPMDKNCPTLTYNTLGRHQSRLVRTRIASNLSPWLSRCEVGDIHLIAISHGEGRFVAPAPLLDQLAIRGQIATQYVGTDGIPSMDLDVNPNGSLLAIEGITSPDGRVFGKMGHTERWRPGVFKNIPIASGAAKDEGDAADNYGVTSTIGTPYQPIFEAGVAYFRD